MRTEKKKEQRTEGEGKKSVWCAARGRERTGESEMGEHKRNLLTQQKKGRKLREKQRADELAQKKRLKCRGFHQTTETARREEWAQIKR